MMRARSQLAPPRLWLYILAALMLPSFLAFFGVWLEGEYDRMRRTAGLVDIVAQRRVRALELIGNLRKAETEQRGYVITRNPQFLTVYEPSRDAVRRDLEVVVRPSPVAPFADARRTELRALIAAKFMEMDAVIAEIRRGQVASAVSRVAAGQGRALMGRIEQQLQAIIAADAALLAEGRARYQDRTQRSRQIVWALVVIVGALMLIGMVMLWYSRRERWQVAIAQADASMRNQAVLDSTSDAIVILNPSGTIENVNAAARSVLGYEPAELSRRDLSVMLDIAGGEGSFHERIGLVDGKLRQTLFVDRFARTKDGRSIPVDVALGLHRREVEQIKDDFIATVSHELRTPLTSVVGSLGLLRGGAAGSLPAGAQQLIDIAENNARRLIRLTNDILDLEKFGSGQMSLEREPTDMAVIMRQAADECQASARIKSIAIEANYPAETCLVSADHQRLLQVAGNLLSNAIRHTPERSTITICVALKAGMIETRICDQGPGVPAEYRKQIFERFVQAPAGGSGRRHRRRHRFGLGDRAGNHPSPRRQDLDRGGADRRGMLRLCLALHAPRHRLRQSGRPRGHRWRRPAQPRMHGADLPHGSANRRRSRSGPRRRRLAGRRGAGHQGQRPCIGPHGRRSQSARHRRARHWPPRWFRSGHHSAAGGSSGTADPDRRFLRSGRSARAEQASRSGAGQIAQFPAHAGRNHPPHPDRAWQGLGDGE